MLYLRSDTMDIATSSISYFEEQLTHQLKLATARLSISDVEDEDKDPVWTENARNDDEDSEYDSDRDWEAVSNIHYLCCMLVHYEYCVCTMKLNKVISK